MQAAPASAIRSMLTAGSSDKLIFCFTHFDAVEGDNLATASARARHVVGSAENLLASIRDEFNPRSERALRRRLEGNRVFLSDIDKPLDGSATVGRKSIAQFHKLLDMIERVTDRPELGVARPVYDKTNLVLAVVEATTVFHRPVEGEVGRRSHPGSPEGALDPGQGAEPAFRGGDGRPVRHPPAGLGPPGIPQGRDLQDHRGPA